MKVINCDEQPLDINKDVLIKAAKRIKAEKELKDRQ